ncbi:MAG TPA: hypothetical protein VF039_12030 [Longimicrobiales bacterium]
MKTHARATLPLLLLALAAACARGAGEPAPRSGLAGVWDLVTVDGAQLPAPSPEEPNVLLRSVTMTLGNDGEYALLSAFRMQGQAEDTEATIGGTWKADGDALTFYTESGGPAVVQFGIVLEGETLLMTDEVGHVWAMRRRR